LNVRYEKTIDFATMIIVEDLFKDDKTLISYYFSHRSAPYGKKLHY